MDANLELARAKVTNRYLAENLAVSEAERFLDSMRETTAFLERRVAREKIVIAKSAQTTVISETVRVS